MLILEKSLNISQHKYMCQDMKRGDMKMTFFQLYYTVYYLLKINQTEGM